MIGVIHGVKLDIGVSVDKVIEPLCAHHHGGDEFPPMQRLFRVVDHACLG
ncbi:hypothetical protein SDC9_144671 [bioreactor metagenome]|uniref:Uncharacterized protein n=1 Tax=bioreactor metagenome TaxID=1076179 RepID=A0A645E8E4_9ZZZZ